MSVTETVKSVVQSRWGRRGILFHLAAILLFAVMLFDMRCLDGRWLLFLMERNQTGIPLLVALGFVGLGFICYAIEVWARRKSALLVGAVLGCSVLLVALLIFPVVLCLFAFISESTPDLSHGYWHDCRDNCNLFDEAKHDCAEQRGLKKGTVVTWQDIQPFFTNTLHWELRRFSVPLGEIPKCPAGGTYTLNPVGYLSKCSVPYHQWDSCRQKKERSGAWRVYGGPHTPND